MFMPKAEWFGHRPLARNNLFCLVRFTVSRLMDTKQRPGKVCEKQTDDYDEGDEREIHVGSYVGPPNM